MGYWLCSKYRFTEGWNQTNNNNQPKGQQKPPATMFVAATVQNHELGRAKAIHRFSGANTTPKPIRVMPPSRNTAIWSLAISISGPG